MKTSDDSDEKEKQEPEQTGHEKPEEQKPIQQPRVNGPMQQRVFEKMGMRLRVKDKSSESNSET